MQLTLLRPLCRCLLKSLLLMKTIVIARNHCSSTAVAYHYSVIRLGLLPTGIGAFLEALACEEVPERPPSTMGPGVGHIRLPVAGEVPPTLPIKDNKDSGALDRRQHPTGAPQLVRDHPELHLLALVDNKLRTNSSSKPAPNKPKEPGTLKRTLRAIPVKRRALRNRKASGLRYSFNQLV